MPRSRKQKKRNSGIFPALLILTAAVIIFGIFGKSIYYRWIPSAEPKDLNEWFEVSGNEVRIYLDGEADFETLAYAENGTVYLSFDYVHDALNSRFYFNSAEATVSYTLPDETIDISSDTQIDGVPALRQLNDGQYYLSLEAVEQYTDITVRSFAGDDEDAKRIFITKGGSELMSSEVKRKTALRAARDIKAPVLEELSKNEELTVKENYGKWCSVITENGITGYAAAKAIDTPETETAAHSYTEPDIEHTVYDGRIAAVWHGIYNGTAAELPDISTAVSGGYINVIAPTWIQLTGSDGYYVNYSSSEYIENAHAAGLRVWAVVDNFNQPGVVEDFDTGSYFSSAAKRRDFIARLMADAKYYGYDGFNIDFEGLKSSSGESFVQFIRELSVECRKCGIVLSVDNYVPYNFNDFYRIDEQGAFADYIIVMLYDEYTSEPGSNASISYVDYGLDKTIAEVPAERVIAGLGLYTRLWSTADGISSAKTMSMTAAREYADNNNMELNWDQDAGQYYCERTNGSVLEQLWLEEEKSLGEKADSVREHGTGGIAIWRLGYDTEEALQILTEGLED